MTVIVPCYNTQEYLAKCIQSIVEQSYQNLEILLINDGSTDDSLKCMQEFAKKDTRIRVLNQENQGVAATRNRGMHEAKGAWILFVDSDDFISKDCIKDLYEAACEKQADIAIGGVEKIVSDGKEESNKKTATREEVVNMENRVVYSKKELISHLIYDGGRFDFPVAKLYKKEILKDILFPVGRVYEDSSCIFKIYENVRFAVVLDKIVYFYIIRPNSITTCTYDQKRLHDNYLMIQDRYKFLIEREPEMKDVILSGFIRNSLTLFERVYTSFDIELRKSEVVKELKAKVSEFVLQVDKNVLFSVLNSRRLACLFLFLQDEEVYCQFIKESK